MSGSPIYIDGKLIGALAYGWSFTKEPIAGVTPIEWMLEEMAEPAPARAAKTARASRAAAAEREIAVLFADGGWQVRDGDEVVSSHPTKQPAVEAARAVAVKRKGGVLVVHLKNGEVQSRTELS